MSQQQRVIRVAASGAGGDFAKVQDAIDAVPLGNRVRTRIVLSPGVYREPVYIAKTKNFITLCGVRPETTVISWDNHATRINHHQSSRLIGTGTFGCGTAIVEGEDFIAENVTFENSAPQGSGQAVAIRVTADRCAFYNCRFLGWQDTLYLHYGKQYLRDCYIEGSVDFIFGNSTALLEHCHIHCKSPGFITAHSRKTSQEGTGYVFLRCVITGTGGTGYSYLGRPWGPYARVVFAYTWIDACIKPHGWHNWGKAENERTACFYEYRCFGPGCSVSNRVTWCRELLDEEAEQFLSHSFVDPNPERPWLLQHKEGEKQHTTQVRMEQQRVVRVAADGTGDYVKVQDAVDSVPLNNRVRTNILISPGVYREPVYVPKKKNLITFRGLKPESTIISWNNTYACINHHQPSEVIGTGTFACGTVIVEGEDFIAENVTFENSAPEGSEQAVALRISVNRCALYNCRFLGWQDTLYLHRGKQYLRDCYIEGHVDFIFGNSVALLEHCHIHCKGPGYITAHGRKESDEMTAYVFLRCVITGNGSSGYAHLGRPWKAYARVVFAYTWIDACINPAGWYKWDGTENEKTASFYEYRCFGPGCCCSCASARVKWCRELSDAEAEQYLAHAFIDPDPKEAWLLQQGPIKIPASV